MLWGILVREDEGLAGLVRGDECLAGAVKSKQAPC